MAELQQVTIPLMRAYESARNGLSNVLSVYSRLQQEYPP
jgi:hypothetical protein